jgi:hypothetical protein
MSGGPDRLYELLPVVHRMRDADQGYPLRALLRVIGEQADVIEDNIAQLYDNWFIETCEDWVVPYIGGLIGYRPVHEAGDPRPVDTLEGRLQNRILIPRREVASTINFRRRKGTLALLELLANGVAGWPARALEFYTLLGWAQHLNHLRLARGRTVDLREGDTLDLLGGPFERLAHTVDVRRPVSIRTPGRYNIPSVGIFIWQLKAYSVTHTPADCAEEIGPQCYTFSVLGNDAPLYTRYEPETEPTHIAEEINLPAPIRRRALEERVTLRPLKTQAAAAYYGQYKSLAIFAPDWPVKGTPQPIANDRVIPADLSDWRYRAARGQVAVDPVLGRMVFPPGQLPKRGVWVTYHYGFSGDLGGGEYQRVLSQPEVHTLYRVSKDKPGAGVFDTINAALTKWRQEQQALGPQPVDLEVPHARQVEQQRLRAAVIEIGDSAVYTEPLSIALEAGESLQIRAGNGNRPVLRLLDYMTERPDAFAISGKQGSRFALDGLLVTGRGLQISGADPSSEDNTAEGDLCDVNIRHCTLVPGWGLDCDCDPKRPGEASIELVNTRSKLVIDHSIIGAIQVVADEVMTDPVIIEITDSILDATSLERVALGAPNLPLAFARVCIARSTVLGEFNTHAILLAENCIFMSPVTVARRQQGCIRFCYITPVSRTPRRYHCQPDLAIAAVDEWDPPVPKEQKPSVQVREAQRVHPRFNSTRYGTPTYCQLRGDCAAEIRRGADDESEMGAFHDLFQPQREANLRVRLDEYTPAGMDAGILFVD